MERGDDISLPPSARTFKKLTIDRQHLNSFLNELSLFQPSDESHCQPVALSNYRFDELREKRKDLEQQLLDLEGSSLNSCTGISQQDSQSSRSARCSSRATSLEGLIQSYKFDYDDECSDGCIHPETQISLDVSASEWKHLRQCLSSLENALQCMGTSLALDSVHDCSLDFKFESTLSDIPIRCSNSSSAVSGALLENADASNETRTLQGQSSDYDFAGPSDDESCALPRSRLDESAAVIFDADAISSRSVLSAEPFSTILKPEIYEPESTSEDDSIVSSNEKAEYSKDMNLPDAVDPSVSVVPGLGENGSCTTITNPEDDVRWLIQYIQVVKEHVEGYQNTVEGRFGPFEVSEQGAWMTEHKSQRKSRVGPSLAWRHHCSADLDCQKRLPKLQNLIHSLSIYTIKLCDSFSGESDFVHNQQSDRKFQAFSSDNSTCPSSVSDLVSKVFPNDSDNSVLQDFLSPSRIENNDGKYPDPESARDGNQGICNVLQTPQLVSLDIDLIGINVAKSQIRSLELAQSIATMERHISNIEKEAELGNLKVSSQSDDIHSEGVYGLSYKIVLSRKEDASKCEDERNSVYHDKDPKSVCSDDHGSESITRQNNVMRYAVHSEQNRLVDNAIFIQSDQSVATLKCKLASSLSKGRCNQESQSLTSYGEYREDIKGFGTVPTVHHVAVPNLVQKEQVEKVVIPFESEENNLVAIEDPKVEERISQTRGCVHVERPLWSRWATDAAAVDRRNAFLCCSKSADTQAVRIQSATGYESKRPLDMCRSNMKKWILFRNACNRNDSSASTRDVYFTAASMVCLRKGYNRPSVGFEFLRARARSKRMIGFTRPLNPKVYKQRDTAETAVRPLIRNQCLSMTRLVSDIRAVHSGLWSTLNELVAASKGLTKVIPEANANFLGSQPVNDLNFASVVVPHNNRKATADVPAENMSDQKPLVSNKVVADSGFQSLEVLPELFTCESLSKDGKDVIRTISQVETSIAQQNDRICPCSNSCTKVDIPCNSLPSIHQLNETYPVHPRACYNQSMTTNGNRVEASFPHNHCDNDSICSSANALKMNLKMEQSAIYSTRRIDISSLITENSEWNQVTNTEVDSKWKPSEFDWMLTADQDSGLDSEVNVGHQRKVQDDSLPCFANGEYLGSFTHPLEGELEGCCCQTFTSRVAGQKTGISTKFLSIQQPWFRPVQTADQLQSAQLLWCPQGDKMEQSSVPENIQSLGWKCNLLDEALHPVNSGSILESKLIDLPKNAEYSSGADIPCNSSCVPHSNHVSGLLPTSGSCSAAETVASTKYNTLCVPLDNNAPLRQSAAQNGSIQKICVDTEIQTVDLHPDRSRVCSTRAYGLVWRGQQGRIGSKSMIIDDRIVKRGTSLAQVTLRKPPKTLECRKSPHSMTPLSPKKPNWIDQVDLWFLLSRARVSLNSSRHRCIVSFIPKGKPRNQHPKISNQQDECMNGCCTGATLSESNSSHSQEFSHGLEERFANGEENVGECASCENIRNVTLRNQSDNTNVLDSNVPRGKSSMPEQLISPRLIEEGEFGEVICNKDCLDALAVSTCCDEPDSIEFNHLHGTIGEKDAIGPMSSGFIPQENGVALSTFSKETQTDSSSDAAITSQVTSTSFLRSRYVRPKMESCDAVTQESDSREEPRSRPQTVNLADDNLLGLPASLQNGKDVSSLTSNAESVNGSVGALPLSKSGGRQSNNVHCNEFEPCTSVQSSSVAAANLPSRTLEVLSQPVVAAAADLSHRITSAHVDALYLSSRDLASVDLKVNEGTENELQCKVYTRDSFKDPFCKYHSSGFEMQFRRTDFKPRQALEPIPLNNNSSLADSIQLVSSASAAPSFSRIHQQHVVCLASDANSANDVSRKKYIATSPIFGSPAQQKVIESAYLMSQSPSLLELDLSCFAQGSDWRQRVKQYSRLELSEGNLSKTEAHFQTDQFPQNASCEHSAHAPSHDSQGNAFVAMRESEVSGDPRQSKRGTRQEYGEHPMQVVTRATASHMGFDVQRIVCSGSRKSKKMQCVGETSNREVRQQERLQSRQFDGGNQARSLVVLDLSFHGTLELR